tara:strand:- start:69 stop:377 length:309 start_codon:yes stop_codon:yes gene_type:complete
MKPISQWIVSTKPWSLRDMMASEVIKKGPASPKFAHAIYNLITSRIDDPDVSDGDIQSLTFEQLGEASGRIAEQIVEALKIESTIAQLESMMTDAQKESKPS